MQTTTDYASDLKLYDHKLHFPAALETAYRQYYYDKFSSLLRSFFWIATIMVCSLAILDYYALPLTYKFTWGIRGIWFRAFFIGRWLSFLPTFKYWLPEIWLWFVWGAGLGVTVMIAQAQPTELGYTFYPVGLLLIMVITCAIQAPVIQLSIANSLLPVVYSLVGIFGQDALATPETRLPFFIIMAFMITMNVLTIMLGYVLDMSNRKEFLQHRLVEQQRVEAEFLRQQADNLLLNILPKEIAAILKDTPNTIANYHENVTILFADVVNFTPMSATMTPTDLVELLHQVFSGFDELVEKYGLEKIKTIGDCYMVAAGIPRARPDHAHATIQLALDMQALVRQQSFLGKQLSFRMGINSGSVVAGVIGQRKFAYDLWGDAVNTASRMESHGGGGLIQITEATYQLIKAEFHCETRGIINVKGKGEIPVWLVLEQKFKKG